MFNVIRGTEDRLLKVFQGYGLVGTVGADRVVASHDFKFNSIEKTLGLARSIEGT